MEQEHREGTSKSCRGLVLGAQEPTMLLDIGQSGKAAATHVNSHPTGTHVHCHSVNPTANRRASQRISGVGARHP